MRYNLTSDNKLLLSYLPGGPVESQLRPARYGAPGIHTEPIGKQATAAAAGIGTPTLPRPDSYWLRG
jgi:hypothetical protein